MVHCELTTPRALRWLAQSQRPRILHLFTDVCNLVNESGAVLSLTTPRVGAGPFSLVLRRRETWPQTAAAPVHILHQANQLQIGSLTVSYGQARCWQPRPAWERLRSYPPEPASALDTTISDLLAHLLQGIAADDEAAVIAAATRLSGRGAGLTPSGDDVLLGVIYALWVWRPHSEWPRRIAAAAAPQTTTLSAAFLRAAADGEATAPWHALAAGAPGARARILATGDRSGAESWAGFVQTAARVYGEPA